MRNLYTSSDWHKYSELVKKRDNFKCVKCGRGNPEVSLQVHHLTYRDGYEIWDYPLSDCVTLCKGCHAREHGLLEPTKGWKLIDIYDLGDVDGNCERKGCGMQIRYEHKIYHPKWGYMIVGSTCVDYLTEEEQILSDGILKLYHKIGNFVYSSDWKVDFTKNGRTFFVTTYKHNQIRIYDDNFSFHILLKEKGRKWFEFQKPIYTKNKTLRQVKELAYVAMLGMLSESEKEKSVLRKIYINLR